MYVSRARHDERIASFSLLLFKSEQTANGSTSKVEHAHDFKTILRLTYRKLSNFVSMQLGAGARYNSWLIFGTQCIQAIADRNLAGIQRKVRYFLIIIKSYWKPAKSINLKSYFSVQEASKYWGRWKCGSGKCRSDNAWKSFGRDTIRYQ